MEETTPRFAFKIRLITLGNEEFGDIPSGVSFEMAIENPTRYNPTK